MRDLKITVKVRNNESMRIPLVAVVAACVFLVWVLRQGIQR